MRIRNPLQIKLFFVYSLVFVLITILASVPTYIYLKRGIEKKALNSMNETVVNVTNKLDASLKEFDNISKQLYLSTDSNGRTVIQHLQLLDGSNGTFDAYESIQAVNNLLGLVTAIYNDIYRLTIYTSKNEVFSNPKARMTVEQAYAKQRDLSEIRQSVGETLFRYAQNDRWADLNDTTVFTFSRLLNPRQNKIAVIEMQIRSDELLPLDQIRSIPGAKLTLSEGDRLLFDSISDNLNTVRKDAYVFQKRIESSNLTIALTVPRSVVLSELTLFRNFALATIFLLITFSLFVYYYLSRLLTQPLVKLRGAIDSIDLEDKRLNIDNKYKVNEIERINRSFRNMNNRLQHSLEQIVQFRTRQLQSQFDTLQAQINPHFLFNMLAIIQVSAENGELSQVQTVSRNLSEFMRYSTSIESPVTILEKEAAFTLRYLELMKTRYMHRLTYLIDLDPGMLHMMVPKLILQPLAENAIQHGFGDIQHPLHIEVTGRLEGHRCELRFRDNGAGFTEDRLAEIKESVRLALVRLDSDFEKIELGLGGMGLTSTIVRLQLMFRNQLQFEIGNHRDGGAEIVWKASISGQGEQT